MLVLAGVTSNLMFPELTSALNENNDELENTSPYWTKYALEPSLINNTSAACVPAEACVALMTYLIALFATAFELNTWFEDVVEKVEAVKNPWTKSAAVTATISTTSPDIAFWASVIVDVLVAV